MTRPLPPEEQRDEAVAAVLERIGYFWGGSYLKERNVPTWGWLRSDGAGDAVPVTFPEQALIDLMFVAADPSLHIPYAYSGPHSDCTATIAHYHERPYRRGDWS